MEQSNKVSGSTKEQDALLALTRGKTVGGQKSFVAAGNHTAVFDQLNPAPMGPAQVVAQTAAQTLTRKASGIFKVRGLISGVASAANLPIAITLLRGGTPIGPQITIASGAGGLFAQEVTFEDPVLAGIPGAYGIQADAGVGNTITVPSDGASIFAGEEAA